MNKKKIVLFQPYLRKHILNLGKHLKHFEFILKVPPISHNSFYGKLPSFEDEIQRTKTGWASKLRRFFGILNVRIKFSDTKSDILFTYGCLLFTNKPYCVYIENGIAPYNYDIKIARNPIARLVFSFLIRMPQCKYLIFMSQVAQKSFLTSVPYSLATKNFIQKKSVQIYPLIETPTGSIKIFKNTLKLLFVGMFYMKGGIELVHAFTRIHAKHSEVTLTIVTPLRTIRDSDIEMMKSIPGLTLIDATLDEAQMGKMYQTHDLFILPTFRDGSPLVLLEALAWGMPIICNAQYATTEVAIDRYNAFVFPNHPLKDYDPVTYRMLGRYYNPKDFYTDLFQLQKEGKLKPVEDFVVSSVEKYLNNPELFQKHSAASLKLYREKFDPIKISNQIEAVFLESLEPQRK